MVQQVDELFNGLSGQLGASPDQLKVGAHAGKGLDAVLYATLQRY